MKFFGEMPFDEKTFGELLAAGTVVKENPVREVLRAGNYFIKHDRRGVRAFKREYENAKFLEKSGIPVVRYAGYASDGREGYLVSEAVENGVDVETFAETSGADETFVREYVEFINFLRAKRLCHGDLHGGNILFVPETRRFLLVDVRSVRHGLFRFYRERAFRELVTDARGNLSREILWRMLREIGVENPRKVWIRQLRADFARTMHEWPKRRKQILSGYRRFTRLDGHFVLDRGAAPEEIATARRFPAKVTALFGHYFLALNHIPTERVIGYDFSCKELLLAQERIFEAAPPEAVADFRERLAVCGIETREEDWRRDKNGRVVLVDWSALTEKLW
ncbi:MAG: hypothetical protein MJ016_02010 [Victivallaceae bacterium]|nr:hypothetical protein [Victivallaceae bacterium]